MQKWRYKTLVIRELALSDSKLNAEGDHGWELVGVLMMDAHSARAFFKQPAETAPELHHDTHTDMNYAVRVEA